jgi:transcriptional regulator with XRE-family HTH domain
MVNQNFYHMKQPELGKKISELRKAKGLTQEELVEKCNLNVRTIQRIESGEVTPRSYTIRALFEALDYHWKNGNQDAQTTKDQVPFIFYAAIGASILYFFLSVFEMGMEQEFMEGNLSVSLISFGVIKTGSYLFYILFLLGWIQLTDYYPNKLLKIALWVMVGVNAIWYVFDLMALFTEVIHLEDYLAVKISSFGFVFAFMGMGYVAYKKQFSFIPIILGVLFILVGFLFFTVFGSILALIPWTVAELVQIGLMIYLILKIGRSDSPNSFAI